MLADASGAQSRARPAWSLGRPRAGGCRAAVPARGPHARQRRRRHTREARPRGETREIGHLPGKSAICQENRPFARKIGHLPGKSAICPENRPFARKIGPFNRPTFRKAFPQWRPHPSKIDSGWCCPPRSRGPEGGTERRKEEK